MRLEAGDIGTRELDTPLLRQIEPGDGVDNGGLARAVRAYKSENLAAGGRDRYALQRMNAAEPATDAIAGKDRFPGVCAWADGHGLALLVPERRLRLSSLPLALRGRGSTLRVKVSGTL